MRYTKLKASALLLCVFLCYLNSFRLARVEVSSSFFLKEQTLVQSEDVLLHNFLLSLPRQNILIVEPYHGLGNRLRAYASAAALARKSGRLLVVAWISDAHVNASMSSLFNTKELHVVSSPVFHLLRSVWPNVILYDYNSEGHKDEVLRDSAKAPIYVRSAYILQSETKVSESEISEELRKLTPSSQVFRVAKSLKKKINTTRPNLVGVHIRMNTDIRTDVPGIEAIPPQHPASAAHMGPVEYERSRCHYKYFVPHLERVLEENSDAIFVVASDSLAAVSALQTHFGSKVVSSGILKTVCKADGMRRVACLQASLAEFIILGTATSLLFLSEWSSASELILRLSGHDIPFQYGCAARKTWLSLGLFDGIPW